MPSRFVSNPHYVNIEFERQLIPDFTPRRCGMSVSRFEYCTRRCVLASNRRNMAALGESYKASDCDCSTCAYKTRKKNCSSPTGCVCLRERLVTGCVPIGELLGVLITKK